MKILPVLFHVEGIKTFLANGYLVIQNLVKGVLADIESSQIIAGIRATAIVGKQLTEPLMIIFTDNAILVAELNT